MLQAWIATALDLGASAGEPPRQESFGAEALLLDPEANRLLLLVVPASRSPPGLAPRLSPGRLAESAPPPPQRRSPER
jgi:hypothetical protein